MMQLTDIIIYKKIIHFLENVKYGKKTIIILPNDNEVLLQEILADGSNLDNVIFCAKQSIQVLQKKQQSA